MRQASYRKTSAIERIILDAASNVVKAELGACPLAGYGGGYIVRAGDAFAPRGDGIDLFDPGGAYVSFGSSF